VITAAGLKQDAPFLQGSWIKPGATVCALGSYQEIDATVVERAGRIFVDNWEVCQHRGNLAPLVRGGRITRADIADEIVLTVLIGVGALDIALAAQALQAARQQGLGLALQ